MLEDARSRFASVLSGSLAGALVSVSIQPLDVVRTRMQGDAVKGFVRGPFSTARVVYNEGQLAALWRGSGPTVLRLSIGAGLHFLLLDAMKDYCTRVNEGSQITNIQNIAIGGLSRGMATTILCPITVVKTRMEYSKTAYKSTVNAILTIARKEGLRGLFSGLAPTVLTTAPFSALHYAFYRNLQSMFRTHDQEQLSMSVNFACGTLSAMGATVLTQPTDVIRTRTQLGMGAGGRWGLFATMQGVVASQGLQGLMTGIVPRMAKRTLQTALIWTIYEELAPRMKAVLRQAKTMEVK